MGHQVIEYTGNSNIDQSEIGAIGRKIRPSGIRLTALLLVGLFVASCAVSSPDLAGLESDATLVDQSVTKPVQPAGVASTDAEVIKTTVAEATLTQDVETVLAWRNPATGSSGTIMAIDRFLGKHGQKCRGFKTTVSTFMGIAFYNGEACQISASEWVLSWFRLSDSKS